MTERLLNNGVSGDGLAALNDIAERCQIFDENFADVIKRVEQAAVCSGRRFEDIHILAATKTIPVEVVNHAIERGIKLIGENKVQELTAKLDGYNPTATRHFIGHLQTNKVRQVVGNVSMIESVDSVKLAGEISRRSEQLGIVTEVLVEVNIGDEQSKSGIKASETARFLEEISSLKGIKVQGLMTIPPICEEKEEILKYFEQMRNLFVDISGKKIDNISMKYLSMGMSDDFEEAILCGANIVRIGTRLFGRRNYSV